MAVFTASYVTGGIGEVWSQAVEFFNAVVPAGGSMSPIVLGTASGYRSALIQATYSGNTYNWTMIASDVDAAAVCSLRHVAQSPGWRRKPNFVLALTGEASASVQLWRGALLTFRRAVWQTWAGAALGATQQSTHVCEAGTISAYLDSFSCHKKYEIEQDAMLLYGRTAGSTPSMHGGVGQSDGLDTYPAPLPISLAGVEAQLAELNASRLDVSINNGAVVVSAVGGTNIT